jgi:simple sugar transport system permease protein
MLFERRLAPVDSPSVIAGCMVGSVVLAFLIGILLFMPFVSNPLDAYVALFDSSLGSLRGLGTTLNRATPLIFVALGTCVAWRSGFGYLGFEGCLTLGAAAAAWFALLALDGGLVASLPFLAFLAIATILAFCVGGAWAGGVGVLRSRFGGNEVLISLMANYVAAFIVQYLVSGPMRAPGSLPQTPRLPEATWLPIIIPGTRAHAGILLALVAALAVWLLMSRMRLGYELVVTGLNPRAARYGGINVGSRYVLAGFLAGGAAAIAGLTEVLGTQHRLLDGLSGGTGFIGIVVALLAKLNPLAVVPTAILYAALSVGADAMQRSTDAPSSIIFILQSLIVLFVIASDFLRYWRIRLPPMPGRSNRRIKDAR